MLRMPAIRWKTNFVSSNWPSLRSSHNYRSHISLQLSRSCRLRSEWQMHDEVCALIRDRVEFNPPLMFLDDPVTRRQPEPDAPADRLGREERVEDLVSDRRVDAAAIIEDVDLDSVRGGTGADGHLSPVEAGVEGVGHEAVNDLVDPGWVASQRLQGGEVQLQFDAPSISQVPDQKDGRFDVGVQVSLLPIALVEAGKSAQVEDDPLNSLQTGGGANGDVFDVLQEIGQFDFLFRPADLREQVGLLIEADQVEEEAEIAVEDDNVVEGEGQGIVDLVGDPGHHLTQPGELLGLHELAVGRFQLVVRLALRVR